MDLRENNGAGVQFSYLFYWLLVENFRKGLYYALLKCLSNFSFTVIYAKGSCVIGLWKVPVQLLGVSMVLHEVINVISVESLSILQSWTILGAR